MEILNSHSPKRRFEITDYDKIRIHQLDVNQCVIGECKLWRVWREDKDYTVVIDGDTDIISCSSAEKVIELLTQRAQN